MLWQRLRAGDEEAYRYFGANFGRKLEHWLRWNGVGQADAIDVAEEAVVWILLRLDRFKSANPVDEKFLAWAWKVARNFAEDWRRSHRPQMYRPLDESYSSPVAIGPEDGLEIREVTNAAKDASTEALRKMVVQLPEKYKEVVLLKAFEGEATWRQVADMTGLTESAARVRYHRAVKMLREIAGSSKML